MLKIVLKTLDILEAIPRLGGEASATEIARALGSDLSSTHRVMRTLASRGYLEQPSGRRPYRLGRALLELAGGDLLDDDLAERLAPPAEELSRKVNENVLVSRLADGELRTLVRIDAGHALVADPERAAHPLYGRADGRLLLAYLDDREIADVFRRIGPPAESWDWIRKLASLRERLAAVRENGFAVTRGESGVTSIAAPLVMKRPDVVLALSIALPTSRAGRRQERDLAQTLLVHSRLIPVLGRTAR